MANNRKRTKARIQQDKKQRIPIFNKPKGTPGRKIIDYKTIWH